MDFDEWVLGAAGDVVAHVARHGLHCTWTEARDRLMFAAGRGQVQGLTPVEDGCSADGEDVFVTEAGEELVPVSVHNPRHWTDPEFVEDVACSHVHWLGQPYYPSDPARSTVAVAIPFTVVAETVQRLTFLLHTHLRSPGNYPGYEDLADLARVATTLAAEIDEALGYVVDQRGLDADLIAESDVILSRSCDLFDAAALVDRGTAAAVSTPDDAMAGMPIVRNRETLRDAMHIECCVRSLWWWLGIGWITESTVDVG